MDDNVRRETAQRFDRAMGALGTAAMAEMDKRLPWFRNLSAEDRSWVGLVAQAGIAAFVEWLRSPDSDRPTSIGAIFGTAPRDLMRSITLQRTVELVRIAIDVVEAQVDELAAPGSAEDVRRAMLLYSREVAFGAARVYARTAEERGAFDARLEALVVDALMRGEVGDGLHAWGAALGWSATPVVVLAGNTPDGAPEATIDDLRQAGRRAGVSLLAGVQAARLVVIVGGEAGPLEAARPLVGHFGAGPVVAGPAVAELHDATRSAHAALSGLRAAAAWPDAPRPVLADDLLAERAIDGDIDAREDLLEGVYLPLAGTPLLETLSTYLEHGASLEATARMLFVHPNTVRYRLRKVADLTGYEPSDGREAFALHVSLILGRLAGDVPHS